MAGTISRVIARLNRDSLPHFFRLGTELVRQSLDARMASYLAAWWGVELGKGCEFFGLPIFRRPGGARVRVGPACRFLSATHANLHGINHPCMISALRPGALLWIGESCGFSGTVICASLSVTLGDRVMCGANCTITDTDSHSLDYRQRKPADFGLNGPDFKENVRCSPIIIKSDVWLGMGVMVLKGVTIGSGSVIGAGSVVANDIPPHVIAAGVPAKPIRELVAH